MEQERNWGAEEWRAPDIEEGDEILFSECGRVVQSGTYGHGQTGIDYRSHYFTIVKNRGWAYLLVKHGAGQERIEIDYSANRVTQFFVNLDSTERYLLMHVFYNIHKEAARNAHLKTKQQFQSAFVSGKLKKRKIRGTDAVKVWIETI